MSKMIPRRSIDIFRNFVDVSLDNYGFDVDLYIPTNKEALETLDIYSEPSDFEFNHYTTQVFVEWRPSIYRLKNLGIYVEDELPIIVYLPNQCTNDSGIEVDVDILRNSYIKVPLEYIPNNFDKYTEFELTTPVVKHMHDAVLVKSYKAVPKRLPEIAIRGYEDE
ncbi:MAG: hypothetical protein ACTSU7_15145 [Candidatus Heimdallarchaeaceae archaeon]